MDPLRTGLIFSLKPIDSTLPSSSNNNHHNQLHPPPPSSSSSSSILANPANASTTKGEEFPSSTSSNTTSLEQTKPFLLPVAVKSTLKDSFERLYRQTPLPAILSGKIPPNPSNYTVDSQQTTGNSGYYYVPSSSSYQSANSVTTSQNEQSQQSYQTPAMMPPPVLPPRPPAPAPAPLYTAPTTITTTIHQSQPITAPTNQVQPTNTSRTNDTHQMSSSVSSIPPKMPTINEEEVDSVPIALPPSVIIASPPPDSIRSSNDLVSNIYQQVMAKLAHDVVQHLSPQITRAVQQQISQSEEENVPIEHNLSFDEDLNEPSIPVRSNGKKSTKSVVEKEQIQKMASRNSSSVKVSKPSQGVENVTSTSEQESDDFQYQPSMVANRKVRNPPAAVNSLVDIPESNSLHSKPPRARRSSSSAILKPPTIEKKQRIAYQTNSLLAIADTTAVDVPKPSTTQREGSIKSDSKAPIRPLKIEFSNSLLSTVAEPVDPRPRVQPSSSTKKGLTSAISSPVTSPPRQQTSNSKPRIPQSPSLQSQSLKSDLLLSEEDETHKNNGIRSRKSSNQDKSANNDRRRTTRRSSKAIVSTESSSPSPSSAEEEIEKKDKEENEEQIEKNEKQIPKKRKSASKSVSRKTNSTKKETAPIQHNNSSLLASSSPLKRKEPLQNIQEFSKLKETLFQLSQETSSPNRVTSNSSLLQTTSKPWDRKELIALYAIHSKTDILHPTFWETVSKRLRDNGINRSKMECEQQWYKSLQETEERKAANMQKKKLAQVSATMGKFENLVAHNEERIIDNLHKGGGGGSKKRGKQKEPSQEEEDFDNDDEQVKKKKPRISKKDLQILAEQTAIATKKDDIFDSKEFKKQLQNSKQLSAFEFSTNLLQTLSDSISSPKLPSAPLPVPATAKKSPTRKYSNNRRTNKLKEKDSNTNSEDDEEEDRTADEELKEEMFFGGNAKKHPPTKEPRKSIVTTSSLISSSLDTEPQERLFQNNHIQKINKNKIQPQVLLHYPTNKTAAGAVKASFGGSSSLLSSLYSQSSVAARLDERDYVKQQNELFNQNLKKSFQKMSKLQKKEQEEEEEEEEEEDEEMEDVSSVESDTRTEDS